MLTLGKVSTFMLSESRWEGLFISIDRHMSAPLNPLQAAPQRIFAAVLGSRWEAGLVSPIDEEMTVQKSGSH